MDKSPDAFRTISEVAEDLDIPQHVLRFWESRFNAIKPLKRGGGRRYYRPEDVDLLKGIRDLLYGHGYTVRGVQRILKENGPRSVQAIGRGDRREALPRPEPLPGDLQGDDADGDAADGADTDADPTWNAGPDPSISETHVADRLPGAIIPERRDDAGGAAFAGDEIARLREAFDELLECRRILGTLRSD